jgi:small-conductance mechanosensitive channel
MLLGIVIKRKEVRMSQQQNVVRMQRQVRNLQQAIGSLGPVMRGSVVVIGTRNKQPYFSLNKDKRTRLIYLGQKRVALARQYSQNYKRLLAIVEEMTILNMELLKRDADL